MVKEIDFSQPPCMYWGMVQKLNYLQRRIIVYSLMYYDMNQSCISDEQYGVLAKQLERMQKEASARELEASRYYYAMSDFEASTGYDIPGRLNPVDREYLEKVAMIIYRQWEDENQ